MEIKPFCATFPENKWLNALISEKKQSLIKGLLEPRTDAPISTLELRKCQDGISALLESGSFQKAKAPALFIYQKEREGRVQTGVWALTDLSNRNDARIITHEQTLPTQQERLRIYRKNVRFEGSPILLTYPDGLGFTMFLRELCCQLPKQTYRLEDENHHLYPITEPAVQKRIMDFFRSLPKVYLADGHHRLAAANALNEKGERLISSLYVSDDQLTCEAFHRLIRPSSPLDARDLIRATACFCVVFEVPGNVPFRPERKGQLGMYYKRWYRLEISKGNLDLPDAQILQEELLQKFFEIGDPRTDPRLTNWPNRQFEALTALAESTEELVIFTLSAVDPEHLLQIGDRGMNMPPKTTYIEPKVPFGLLMYQN